MPLTLTCKNHPEVQDGIGQCAGCSLYFCEDCLVTREGRRLCATCKDAVGQSPGGLVGHRLASLPLRAAAVLIDSSLWSVAFFGTLWAAGVADDYFQLASQPRGIEALFPVLSLRGLVYVLPSMATFITYEALMLQWRAQTVGKMLVRIKVIGARGEALSVRQVWLRPIAQAGLATFLGQLGFIDYLAVFIGKQRATVHDRIAGTRVVAS